MSKEQEKEAPMEGGQKTGDQHWPPRGPPYRPPFRFTEEERRVMKECNYESLLFRALPLAAISAGITNVLISRDVLKGSGRWGRVPKLAAASILGFIVGRFSYRRNCMEKLKNLKNSEVGKAIREGKMPYPLWRMHPCPHMEKIEKKEE
uniref:OCIA domain-containing protein 1-like n=1 Tax=Myxine glutinosa TaxID=7769 RepID=UPI00358F0E5E